MTIKQILQEKNMSQNQLSMSARIPASSISQIVNGRVSPGPMWRKRISDVLDISQEILFPQKEVK
jgi:transcriptional regulator with XRE-family HTH domain